MGTHPQHRPDWANLDVLHRNTLPPRSNFVVYDNEKDAISRDLSKAKAQSLSGTWKFDLVGSPFEAPSGFDSLTFDDSNGVISLCLACGSCKDSDKVHTIRTCSSRSS